MRKALGKLEETELSGIGVDAWGVDYALLGERGELLQNPYHHRAIRTRVVMEEVFWLVSKDEIYFRLLSTKCNQHSAGNGNLAQQ